ncbi:MAG: hypothetical protein SGILL_000445 [Bacillariaceae sp.]
MSEDDGGGRRSRRAKSKVNYAKEQDFSDEDIFGDEQENEVEARTPATKRGRPKGSSTKKRKPKNNDDGAQISYMEEDDYRPHKPQYTEKGYDSTLLPIRERFPFLPEHELDGSPRIDLIVGRRPVDEKEAENADSEGETGDNKENSNADSDDSESEGRATRGRKKKRAKSASPTKGNDGGSDVIEYEYLVKYKNRSYLHLEWKTGADLESMNKSAKTIYRRYLKKIAQGLDEDLEDPNFDPSFAEPQKIVAEEEQALELELTDEQLLKWETEKEKELAEEESSSDEEKEKKEAASKDVEMKTEQANGDAEEKTDEDLSWKDEEMDFSKLTIEKLRAVLEQEGPYYPVFEGCNNPYRDGYVTEPPKKPRASYLFFQCAMRSYFTLRNPDASLGELMTIIGNTWHSMSEEERGPFLELAKEEAQQYEKERSMMERAQRPNEMWQPLRRCLMVLDHIAEDGFANIFLEPVDVEDFPDYEEYIDTPMDLGTVRRKIVEKKYMMPEQFARDVRKVSARNEWRTFVNDLSSISPSPSFLF